jgi:hypothetical protein
MSGSRVITDSREENRYPAQRACDCCAAGCPANFVLAKQIEKEIAELTAE